MDSLGKPPWLGLHGGCGGWVTDRQITATGWEALEEEYEREKEARIDGPSYFAGAAGKRATDAVVTIGITGLDRVAERPAGRNLVLGIVAPLLLIAGLAMVFWRRPQML